MFARPTMLKVTGPGSKYIQLYLTIWGLSMTRIKYIIWYVCFSLQPEPIPKYKIKISNNNP